MRAEAAEAGELALRVNKLGRSSVTHEVACFEKGVDEVRAVGECLQISCRPD